MSEIDVVSVDRRTVVKAAGWGAPAILLAKGLPMASASQEPPVATVFVAAVRAAGPNWEGTGTLAPGFRFGMYSAGVANLMIEKLTGPAATFTTIFTKYQSATWTTNSIYTATNVSLAAGLPNNSANTIGITMNAVDGAVGRYVATISPVGGGTPATAQFEITKSGTTFQVHPSW
jgi:hypothetical protein